MILKMEKLSALGLRSDRESILRALMKQHCVQMTPVDTMTGYEQLAELTRQEPVSVYADEQQLARYTAALSAIAPYMTKTGMFTMKPRVLFDGLDDSDLLAQADAQCSGIERTMEKISDLRGIRGREQFLRASLAPWEQSDLPLEQTETRSTVILRLLVPSGTDQAELERICAEAAPASYWEEVSQDREQRYMIFVCHRGEEQALWEALKGFGATRATFPGQTGLAADVIAALDTHIAEIDANILKCEDSLRETGKDLFPLKYAYDAYSVRIQRERSGESFLNTEKTFCFTGWVPETAKEAATKILEQYGCYFEFRECTDEEEPPILLKNGKIVSNYEAVTEMYSLPAYRCLDPDFFLSIFYFIFFGMMLSDAGFGLVLLIGGLILYKKADLGPNAKKLTRVITMGGLSAVIWGTIFGSWFGDVIPVVGNYFFGREITVFQLIDPLEDAVLVMALSMALGLIHIFVGMGLKAYLMVKRGHPWQALFDVGFWFMVLAGAALMLVAMIFMGTDSTLFTVTMWIAIVGAAGLVFTQGREKKNPIMKLLSGIMSLYDITGYLSDVLSYSRILALGLATGVIAQVFNIMGTMPGNRIIGFVVFLLVFVAGSALNLGINTLGAYVHTARLQYVEFFGKFYEAGGKPFTPLMARTKYLVVTNKEEMES